MQYQWVFSCALVAVLASSALGLDCFSCEDKEKDNACGKMGLEFDASAIETITCPEPEAVNKTGRAVCVKTITTYQAVSDPDNSGVVASRYCDVVDTADVCESQTGGRTTTATCVCSDADKCNAAPAANVFSLTAVLAGLIAAAVAML